MPQIKGVSIHAAQKLLNRADIDMNSLEERDCSVQVKNFTIFSLILVLLIRLIKFHFVGSPSKLRMSDIFQGSANYKILLHCSLTECQLYKKLCECDHVLYKSVSVRLR